MLGYDVDTESMTIALPTRKVEELRARLADWPAGRQTAAVREGLVVAEKLHDASFVIRPGRYFIRSLLQVSNLHIDGAERAGGGGGLESSGKRGELYSCRVRSRQTWDGRYGFRRRGG